MTRLPLTLLAYNHRSSAPVTPRRPPKAPCVANSTTSGATSDSQVCLARFGVNFSSLTCFPSWGWTAKPDPVSTGLHGSGGAFQGVVECSHWLGAAETNGSKDKTKAMLESYSKKFISGPLTKAIFEACHKNPPVAFAAKRLAVFEHLEGLDMFACYLKARAMAGTLATLSESNVFLLLLIRCDSGVHQRIRSVSSLKHGRSISVRWMSWKRLTKTTDFLPSKTIVISESRPETVSEPE